MLLVEETVGRGSEIARGNESFSIFANVDDSPGQEGCWARHGIASVKELKGKAARRVRIVAMIAR